MLFGTENGRALSAIVPPELARQIKLQWAGERGDLFRENERGLVAKMQANGKTASAAEYALRVRFWFEYDRVMEERKPTMMDMAYVLGRGYSKEKFYRAITDPYFLAFLILPPSDYKSQIEAALSLGMNRLMAILETPHIDPSGYVNHQVLEKIIKVVDGLHGKAMGMQRKKGRQVDNLDGGGVPVEAGPVETPEQKLVRLRAEREERQKQVNAQSAQNNPAPEVDGE